MQNIERTVLNLMVIMLNLEAGRAQIMLLLFLLMLLIIMTFLSFSLRWKFNSLQSRLL
jgi:hypothetical protein